MTVDADDRLTREDLARLPWVTYRRTHDAAHIWLRETAARVGRRMAGEPGE
ncbi:hypothetical protein [Streptomyces coelicoflavus]|uniref:hypothetical protein n=1 Tax=Streptomyces coelicoflavus TaxID=285562 RepID=UPI0036B5338A